MGKEKIHLVIVGGGSTYTPGLLLTILDNKETFPLKKVTLLDIDYDRQHPVAEFARAIFKRGNYDVEVSESTDQTKAFDNADFVLMQIRTGGLHMRDVDETVPLKYGKVGQETTGAGGIAYGLRSVTDMISLIKEVRKQSPDAWVLNYSNPAAIVAQATRRAFPNDKKIVNMCDAPAELLREMGVYSGHNFMDLRPQYFGLNHFGWFTKVYDPEKKEDILPGFRKLLMTGRDNIKKVLGLDDYHYDWGFFSVVRNVNVVEEEYVPSFYMQYYYYPEDSFERENKEAIENNNRAKFVMAHREKNVFNIIKKITSEGKEEDIQYLRENGRMLHNQYMLNAAISIYHNQGREFILIVENDKGYIPNLPKEFMVEIVCKAYEDRIEPIKIDPIDDFYKALLINQGTCENLVVEALFERDKHKLLKAFILNRLVNDAGVAEKLVDDLIEANKEYWGKLLK